MKSFNALAATAALALVPASAIAGGFDSESVTGDLSAYTSVYVAPVSLALENVGGRYPATGFRERPVSDADAARKAADLHGALVSNLTSDFVAAQGPGPGVLTVAATLTKLSSSRPTQGDYAAQPGLSFSSVYAGGAAVTIDFSEDGRALGSVADDYDTSLGDGRPRVGIWDDADRAFSSWARRLPEFIRGK